MSGADAVPVAALGVGDATPPPSRPSLAARTAILAIRGYQYAFTWARPNCRFWPTCSQYTLIAVEHHGAWRGMLMGVRRIGRCHPWHPGGHDPVPGVGTTNTRSMSAPDLADAEGRNQ